MSMDTYLALSFFIAAAFCAGISEYVDWDAGVMESVLQLALAAIMGFIFWPIMLGFMLSEWVRGDL